MQRVDQQMTRAAAEASLRNPQSTAIQCLKCDNSSQLCYVVMKNRSIAKSAASLVSTVTCPVHGGQSSSTWSAKLYETVEAIAARTQVDGLIWDRHDVPGIGNHHMHIGACVISGARCARIEIDGESHFQGKGTRKEWRDKAKDSIFRDIGVGLLHLHWRDVGDCSGSLHVHSHPLEIASHTPQVTWIAYECMKTWRIAEFSVELV
jgi:hypothetical protein